MQCVCNLLVSELINVFAEQSAKLKRGVGAVQGICHMSIVIRVDSPNVGELTYAYVHSYVPVRTRSKLWGMGQNLRV